MTSQHKPSQKAQDDAYSNQDKGPHDGPIKSREKQPGPKVEKKLPSTSDPVPEKQTDKAPVSDQMTPEKDIEA